MGDFTIDLLKFSNHGKTNDYLENIFSQGHIPLITKPTRVASHSATLTDHIYTNKLQYRVLLSVISQTTLAFSLLYCHPKKNYIATEPILFRSFKQENIIKFKTILADTEFTPSLETQCANTSYDTFTNSYMGAYNYAFPKLNCKAQNKYRKHSPWITKGLIQSSITNQNF